MDIIARSCKSTTEGTEHTESSTTRLELLDSFYQAQHIPWTELFVVTN